MTYITFFIISIIGIIQCIYSLFIKKRSISIKNSRFILGIISLIVFLFLCLDLPSFVSGGITANVNFEEVNGGKKSIIHTYRDVNGNSYWSGGSLDHNWNYFKWYEDKNTIRFLPYSRCILNINRDGYEVYNQWQDLGFSLAAVIAVLLWEILKEIPFKNSRC